MIDGDVDGPVSNVGNGNQGVIADSVSVGTFKSNKTIHHGEVRNHHGDVHFHIHPSPLGEILSTNPVSSLESAFATLKDIFDQHKQVEANKTQLLVLNESFAQLLKTLNGRYENQELVESQTEGSLDNLERLLDDVATFTETCTSQNILKQVMTKENRQSEITGYHHRIQSLMTSLQTPTPIHIQDAQARDNEARVEDQRILDRRLDNFPKLRRELTRVLDDTIGQSTAPALMVSLQRRSQTTSSDAEKRFLNRAHKNLSATTLEQTKVESWMITSYEVEFVRMIGSGGFGQVFLGKWGKTEVALKVFRVENGATPSAQTVRREVEIWASLRNTHILAFYGANVLDERPFIVMAYLKNGNSLDYIDRNPGCNRLRMLHGVSLGLYYLHSKNVVHGDLKAANILIDDAGRAVLADFGLSRVKADATSRTAKHGGSIVAGSRNWMAPELLTGGSLRKPCDVYSFGMTIFKIYTNEIPLSNIPYEDFIEMVVKNHVRPQRQGLPDEIWKLADQCWVPLGKGERPDAGRICDMISHLMQTTPVPSPTPATALPLIESKHPLDTGAIVTSALPIHSLSPLIKPPLPAEKPLRLFEGHTSNGVRSITFSPDGIVSGSLDGTVLVWDANMGSVVAGPFQPHNRSVESLAFSPDGTHVASGSGDMTVRIWDVKTGSDVAEPFEEHYGSVYSVMFSPDGTRIATGSGDRNIRIWDVKTGSVVAGPFRGHTGWVRSVKFSPDGKRVASGSGDRIWDVKTGSVIAGPYEGVREVHAVHSVTFSPDGTRVVSGSSDAIRIWDPQTGSVIVKPLKAPSGFFSITFSPDGTRLCSGHQDGTVLIWDSETGSVVAEPFKGHTLGVTSVAFSPDGTRIASGSDDKTVRLWDANIVENPIG